MNIIAWIILGFIAGAITKMIYPGNQGGGWLSDILLGIVGAILGGSIITLIQTGTLQLTAASLSHSWSEFEHSWSDCSNHWSHNCYLYLGINTASPISKQHLPLR